MSKQATIEKVEALTVSEFAVKHQCCKSSVRNAIERGYLKADRSVRPLRIVGGEMPLTVQRWQSRLAPVVKELKPSLYGWAVAPDRLDVLRGTEVVTFEYNEDWRVLPRVIDALKQIADVHHGR